MAPPRRPSAPLVRDKRAARVVGDLCMALGHPRAEHFLLRERPALSLTRPSALQLIRGTPGKSRGPPRRPGQVQGGWGSGNSSMLLLFPLSRLRTPDSHSHWHSHSHVHSHLRGLVRRDAVAANRACCRRKKKKSLEKSGGPARGLAIPGGPPHVESGAGGRGGCAHGMRSSIQTSARCSQPPNPCWVTQLVRFLKVASAASDDVWVFRMGK